MSLFRIMTSLIFIPVILPNVDIVIEAMMILFHSIESLTLEIWKYALWSALNHHTVGVVM